MKKLLTYVLEKLPEISEEDERYGEMHVSADLNDIFPEEFKAFMHQMDLWAIFLWQNIANFLIQNIGENSKKVAEGEYLIFVL
ncbi:MAG: hypothetical protein R2760_00075 [Chitinophagales bacterium]